MATPTGTKPPAPAPVRQRPASNLLLGATVFFAALALVFGIMAFTGDRIIPTPVDTAASRGAAADIEAEITSVAKEFTETALTFDHATIDADVEAILALTTDAFSSQQHSALGGTIEAFRRSIVNGRAESTGEVKGVALTSRDDQTATALAIVAQTVRNAQNPQPRTQFRVLELTMLNSSDGWRVDNVGNPAATPAS